MDYTPLAHLTDREFVSHLAHKEDPTDEEIEAMLRIEALLETARSNPVIRNKYKEPA